MQQFSSRERLGVVAAGAVVLFLGAGGWAFSHASVPAATRPSIAAATLRPTVSGGAPAALEIAAGGGATSATPAPNAATLTAISTTPGGSAGGAAIFVHVAGAVKTPGVYKFLPGDRINDAVKAAGGFKAGADRDALNLADTLQDADQIFIPDADATAATNSKATAGSAAVIADGPTLLPGGSTVRKSRSRRSSHPLITPGVAPVRLPNIVVGPLPAPPRPGDVVIQPIAAPDQDRKIAAIEANNSNTVIVARRGRVIGRPAPVLAQPAGPAADDASDDSGDDAGTPAIAASVAPRAAYGSSRKSAGIVGSVSKRASSAAKGGAGKSAKFKNPGDGVVHLNSATAEQLEKLPGVGPAMSGRIVEYRTEIGKFTDPSQLMDVKGIGDKKFAKMQPFLML